MTEPPSLYLKDPSSLEEYIESILRLEVNGWISEGPVSAKRRGKRLRHRQSWRFRNHSNL